MTTGQTLYQEIAPVHPDMRSLTKVFAKIGLLSFGGPAGHIALMHRELVDERRWISENRFLHALNFCMLLPGPEAQQLATYIGWLLHGWRGGVIAGTLFILPGFFVILALSSAYALFADTAWLSAVFFGMKAAILAVVIEAVIRVGRRSLKNRLMQLLAALAFVALFVFNAPFPLVVFAAGLIGYFGSRLAPALLHPRLAPSVNASETSVIDDHHITKATSSGRTLATILFWGLLWLVPFILTLALTGGARVFTDITLFFSKMAVVTFGGAYAVLTYVAQQAVDNYHWLNPGEMLDGLALAETTPGPLVLVLTFVGFMAAFRSPTALAPLTMGIGGAVLTTWVTFVPCFLWIFLGAPYIEKLRAHRPLTGALSAISAAVTGVILNLAVWFALHVLFARVDTFVAGPVKIAMPDPASVNWASLALSALSVLLIFRMKKSPLFTMAVLGALGVAIQGFYPV